MKEMKLKEQKYGNVLTCVTGFADKDITCALIETQEDMIWIEVNAEQIDTATKICKWISFKKEELEQLLRR